MRILLLVVFLALPRAAAALSYVALGDSIAVGAGDGGGGGYVARYRDAAASDLGAPVTLANLAVGGSTSGDLLAALTSDQPLRDAVDFADLVTFDIGGNDVLIALFAFKGGSCGGADGEDCLRAAVAGFDANWPAILGELRVLNAGAAMRTMTYYNPFIVDLEPGDGTAAAVKPYLRAVNETIVATAAAFGIAVADVAGAFNGPGGGEDPIAKGYIDPDHIHPSPLGYDVLAEAFHALGYPPMPGTSIQIPSSLALKYDVLPPLDPSKRRLSFTASTKKGQGPANRVVPPLVGGLDDPRSAGAVVTVYNAAGLTTDRAVVALPASGWSLVGSDGFRFKGTGPVTGAVVMRDKLKVKAKGAGFDYTLDEPAQGAVALRFGFGGGVWCAAAPAKLSGSPPSSASNDRPGKFVGQRKAPAPASCPPDDTTPSPAPTATVTPPAQPTAFTPSATSMTATPTPTPTSTATPPATGCGGPTCAPCGSCGDGVCTVEGGSSCGHADTGRVCISNGTCTSAVCASDADCGAGKACVVTVVSFCCALCP